MVNVNVKTPEPGFLDMLAGSYGGRIWFAVSGPERFEYDYAFPDMASATMFIAALPSGCQGVIDRTSGAPVMFTGGSSDERSG